ncbi:MAG: hypothetical protein ACR2PY_05245 [Salinispira sp.]
MNFHPQVKTIIDFWQELNTKTPPFVHPRDSLSRCLSYEEYKKIPESDISRYDTYFHTSLMPVPYYGDIQNAKVYVLYLNPGFCPDDYAAERERKGYFQLFVNGLRQNGKNEYPFPFISPQHDDTPAGRWWMRKLRRIIEHVAEQKNISRENAVFEISQKIATLELVAYHSTTFNGNYAVVHDLPSSQMIRNFVREYALPRAREDKACIIITRGKRIWNLTPEENVIIYDRNQARGAHLTSGFPAWPSLCKFLL